MSEIGHCLGHGRYERNDRPVATQCYPEPAHASRSPARLQRLRHRRPAGHQQNRPRTLGPARCFRQPTPRPSAGYLVDKIAGLRIFGDQDGKDEPGALADIGGSILAVSQFTLYGDVRRGKRPSFDSAARPERARELYDYFIALLRSQGLPCETGQFQATMSVGHLVNEGPVTILLDSSKIF